MVRFIQLGLIFLPSILLLPLAIFKATRVMWLNCFVWSISKAGVVWIKVFQHMSHRADVIGEELAESC
jgi:predicted unusual protein kinase regulating ubiquinone biosynthesis (AarF/ABC1/UbiB family)